MVLLTWFTHGIPTLNLVNDERAIMAGVKRWQWPLFMKDAYRVCKPGTGWAQIIEISAYLYCDDGSVPDDAAIFQVKLHPLSVHLLLV